MMLWKAGIGWESCKCNVQISIDIAPWALLELIVQSNFLFHAWMLYKTLVLWLLLHRAACSLKVTSQERYCHSLWMKEGSLFQERWSQNSRKWLRIFSALKTDFYWWNKTTANLWIDIYMCRNTLFSEHSLLQEPARPLPSGRQHLYVLVLLVSVSSLLAFRQLLPSLALTAAAAESLQYSAAPKPACGNTTIMCLFQGASHNFMHAFLCMCLSICCISHSYVERNETMFWKG